MKIVRMRSSYPSALDRTRRYMEVPAGALLVRCPLCAAPWDVGIQIDHSIGLRCLVCGGTMIVGSLAFPSHVIERGATW